MRFGTSYRLTDRARREMRQAPADMRHRIFAALDRLMEDPPVGDVRKLHGKDDEWRLRVGDWRVRFRHDQPANVLVVTRVLPRGRAYRD